MKYFIFYGPTASGKSALMEYLLINDSDYLEPLISFTTRAMKTGEKEGTDYYFISRDQYLEYRTQCKVVEQIHYLDQVYGLTSDELKRVEATNKNGAAIMNLEGIRSLKAKVGYQKVISIFIYRDLNEIVKSIKQSGINNAEQDKRIALAQEELKDINTCDYVVYNSGSFETAYQQLHRIIRHEINSQPIDFTIQAGQKYQDAKGNLVEIVVEAAEHTVNGSILVIYRDLSSGTLLAQPYEKFCGKRGIGKGISEGSFVLVEGKAGDNN
ncbi:guanylate kinase [hydrocarbon metagenome]|uniref:Guanylate kinase n=1 Tax=hydrocarbon metagenome TaxID=938273 RepID=A0A0W8E3G0_9ZZZZ